MSRWDARSLQGAASANEDDGGEALAEALAEAFSGAIKDALGESSARLPMTAFDFELSTHAVQCRVVVMKNSIFLWAGPSKGIAMMPTLSVAATSRLSQAVPLVSTLFDQSGKGALRDGGGGAGGQVVSAKRGMPGTPLPAATTALFGACDASESLAQALALRLSKTKKKAHSKESELIGSEGSLQVFVSCNVAPNLARKLPPIVAEALGKELAKRQLKV